LNFNAGPVFIKTLILNADNEEKPVREIGVVHKVEGLLVSQLQESKLTEVAVGSRRVGLLKRKEVIYAFAATCPHAGTALCNGWLDAMGRIVCPEHKYRFDPANGRNTSGEGYKLITYAVEIKGDDLYIRFLS
jgi:nitrite reductase/ring-hydroxylating ferredoxin subunit